MIKFYRFFYYKLIRKIEWVILNFFYKPFNIFSRVRFVKSKQNLYSKKITALDKLSYVWQYKEIFLDEVYFFNGIEKSQVIIDVGSNIGMSLIFFKKYSSPETKVFGFEADFEVYKVAQKNLELFNFQNIYLENKAAWIRDEVLSFSSDGADGGRIDLNGSKVQAIDLGHFLERFNEIDFLKIDIEGAEEMVFPHIRPYLFKVKNLFLEYHGNETHNFLSFVLMILEQEGFHYKLLPIDFLPLKPFTNLSGSCQINIFATRNN